MAAENSSFSGPARGRVYREQIITTGDLEEFKAQLLDEIGKLFKQLNGEPSKKWLKSQEVRKLLGISPGTLQNLRVNGTLPYTKIGGVIFYEFTDIQGMLEENRIRNSLSSRMYQDRLPVRKGEGL